ncbi:MAG: hypothetical protein RMM06_00135 [Armatimonadota bacterium]|nr:hypothetical protein [bacterium]MCS7309019.1 hypothetical protein [Armatimonadota bacterium]MDW8104517.1 hypothetical protein [Armatimonadota bacterium]MDW8289100.1 hypothetical protein [Armatimonadota bacterium]
MRVVTFLLALLACAGVVYNYQQLREVRQQLEQVQLRLENQRTEEPPALVEAKQRIQRAQQLLRMGKLQQARAELEQGAKAVAEAVGNRESAPNTLQQVQQMLEGARKELARFWSGQQETKP